MKNYVKVLLLWILVSGLSFSTNAQTNTPWSEDFEGSFLPAGWTKEIADPVNDITQDASQNHTASGAYSARFSSWETSTNYNQYLFSMQTQITTGNAELHFWSKKEYDYAETLEWGISTTTASSSAVSSWTAVPLSSSSWDETVVDLSGYIGQDIYIAFHYYGDYLYYVYLDDVSIGPPVCQPPSNLLSSNITSSGADMEWTSVDSFFDIYIVTEGDPPPTPTTTPTVENVPGNSYIYDDGNDASSYDWYVRTDCAAGSGTGMSDWIGPGTFTTAHTNPSECQIDNAIYDNGCSISYTVTPVYVSNVPGLQLGTSASLSTASIIIEHLYVSELQIFLESPNGELVFLSSYNGSLGANYGNPSQCPNQSTIFDMNASNSISSGSAPFIGSFIPEGDFADFEDGSDPNGIWNLWICDNSPGNIGTVEYIALTFLATGSCTAPTAQTATNPTTAGADLAWTSSDSFFDIYIVAEGDPPPELSTQPTINNHSGTSYTWEGGSLATSYDWYVRTDCGAGSGTGLSEWVGPGTFTTLASCPPPTGQTVTNIISMGARLWWTSAELSFDIYVAIAGGPPPTSNTTPTFISNPPPNNTLWTDGDPNTSYDWYIRADCAAGGGIGETSWVGPHTFTTTSTPPAPTNLGETNLTYNSVTLTWTENGSASHWEIDLGPPLLPYVAHSTSWTTPVAPSTQYEWYVRAVQSDGDYSTLSGPSFFTTPCTEYSIWPLNENFDENWDGTPPAPYCWDVVNNDGSNSWSQASPDFTALSEPFIAGATYCFDDYLISPPLSLPDNSIHLKWWDILEFNYLPNFTSYDVLVSTTGCDIPSFNANHGTFTCDNTSWLEHTINLSEYTGQTIYIAFHITHSEGEPSNYPLFGIDDLSVILLPPCADPTDLIETNVSYSSVDLGWTENGLATDWEIEWGITGFSPGTGNLETISTNPYNLTGITGSTTYDWYVRSSCGGGEYSGWVGLGTFTTPCDPYNAIYAQDFEGVTVPELPDCWLSIINYDPAQAGPPYATVETAGDASNTFAYLNNYNNYPDPPSELELVLISPYFSDLTSQLNQIRFEARSLSEGGELLVGTMSDPADGTTFSLVQTFSLNLNYTEYTIEFGSNYTDTDPFIAFKHGGPNYGGDELTVPIFIDNFSYEPIPTATLFWYNLQWPATASIEQDESVEIFAQCYEGGVTEASGPGTGIECWIGYSTSDTDPNTWTNWIPASYNYEIDPDNNDEYLASLNLPVGTYYYASRFRYLMGPYTYGGYNGGEWNGTTNLSGVLTVNPCTAIAAFPWVESFESDYPGCWNEEIVEDTGYPAPPYAYPPDWYKSFNTYIDGSYVIGFNAFWSTYLSSARIETPFIDLSTISNASVAFWMTHHDWFNDPNEGLMVQVSLDGINWVNVGEMILNYNASGWWQRHLIDLSAYDGQTIKVGFLGISSKTEDFFIDLVTIPGSTEWTGAASNNDWDESGNWTNGVPTRNSDVTIPTGLSYYPTVSASASCNDLLIKSDASGDASLLDNELLSVHGNLTVERNLSADQFHGFSPSVDGEQAGMFHLPGSTGLDVYLYGNDEANYVYTNISALGEPLDPFTGYMVWVDGVNATPTVTEWTFSETGTLTTGIIGLTDNIVMSDPGGFTRGWNFLGNPYISAIDWDATLGWTKTDIDATIYLFTGSNWATYNSGTGGVNDGTRYIAMGQAFFIHKTDHSGPYPETGTLIMDNNVRVHNNVGYMKSSLTNRLSLLVEGNESSDETAILFREDATVGFDSKYDAYKFESTQEEVPSLYSLAGEKLAVNVIPQTEYVQLGFKVGVNNSFTISANEITDMGEVTLEDKLTAEFTNLNVGTYTFNYSIDDPEDRFIVHFAPTKVPSQTGKDVDIYSYQKNIYINVPENTKGQITIYDMMGKEVANEVIIKSLNIITLQNRAFYIVRVVSDDNIIAEKVFVK